MKKQKTSTETIIEQPKKFDIYAVQWHSIVIQIENTHRTHKKIEDLNNIIEAFLKTIHRKAEILPHQTEHILFHLPELTLNDFNVELNKIYTAEICFFNLELELIQNWVNALTLFFETEAKNFVLKSISDIQINTLESLPDYSEIQNLINDPAEDQEICLNFLTPFAFKIREHTPKTDLTPKIFLMEIERRFMRIFNQDVKIPIKNPEFDVLNCFWHYAEIQHQAKSASSQGNTQLLKGCVGKLYLKGNFKAILPYLLLAQKIHLGPKISFGVGYFEFEFKASKSAYFEPQMKSYLKKDILATIEYLLHSHDNAVEQIKARQLDSDFRALANQLADRVMKGYEPTPHQTFNLPKQSGGTRLIEKLAIDDLIIEKYLQQLLMPYWDKVFLRQSIAYRTGSTRESAIGYIEEYVNDGYIYALKADISQFFPSVNIEKLKTLFRRYLPLQDKLLLKTLDQSLNSSYWVNQDHIQTRDKGISMGSPLSPLFSNLYLHSFDLKLAEAGFKWIRYADDFIIFSQSKTELTQIRDTISEFLAPLDLILSDDKCETYSIQQEGLSFLGLSYNPNLTHLEKTGLTVVLPLKKPLYITTHGLIINVNHETLEIRQNKELIEVLPIHRISEIMVLAHMSFSSRLVDLCSTHHIPLNFALRGGYQFSTLRPDNKNFYTTIYQQALKYDQFNEADILGIAKSFATYKIKNYLTYFQQRLRKNSQDNQNHQAMQKLSILERNLLFIEQATTLDEVRGLEGASAKFSFQQLNHFIKNPEFHLKKRLQHFKEVDYINSLLNFGYYLLFARINSIVHQLGLHPYLGFLHSPENRYESLVCDIQELFRVHIDALIIQVLSFDQITTADFVHIKRIGKRLKGSGLKLFVNEFEKMMNYKDTQRNLSLLEYIYYQVSILKAFLSNESQTLTYYVYQPILSEHHDNPFEQSSIIERIQETPHEILDNPF